QLVDPSREGRTAHGAAGDEQAGVVVDIAGARRGVGQHRSPVDVERQWRGRRATYRHRDVMRPPVGDIGAGADVVRAGSAAGGADVHIVGCVGELHADAAVEEEQLVAAHTAAFGHVTLVDDGAHS